MNEDSGQTHIDIEAMKGDNKAKSFLIDDYKLKVDYLAAHFGRMWNRFNYFLTIEVALFGFLGHLLFREGRDVQAVPVPIILGIGASIVWLIVGAQDRVLVNHYRNDERGVAAILSDLFNGLGWYKDYYVGSGKGAPEPYYPKEESRSRLAQLIDRLLFSRYWDAVSITRFAAILPFLLVLVWGIILLMSLMELWVFSKCW